MTLKRQKDKLKTTYFDEIVRSQKIIPFYEFLQLSDAVYGQDLLLVVV